MGTILVAGPGLLLLGIGGVVVVAIAVSYGIGRLFGLRHRMAVLVACGNSIWGNSAIAAVAPGIGADGEDVAASIVFTAVLGVLVVLELPFLPPLLHLSGLQYGALAGLTVYAVPQVLAATTPFGALAIQIGTLVKLVRVLMVGPVVLMLTLLTRRMRDETDESAPHLTAGGRPAPGKLALHTLVPWFILGFLALAADRGWFQATGRDHRCRQPERPRQHPLRVAALGRAAGDHPHDPAGGGDPRPAAHQVKRRI